jgi:hypothetical protein
MLRTKLRNVKIIPGIPILREDGPGSLGKQLVELTYWFKSVYEKNTLVCLPVWDKLLECIGKTDEDGLDLGYTEFYTVALPISLTPKSDLTPVKFKFSSSHTTIRGIDCEASHELLCTLLDLLQKEFASVANSDEILSREPAPQVPSAKVLTHCIVIGGSNMKNLCPRTFQTFRLSWTCSETWRLGTNNLTVTLPSPSNLAENTTLGGRFWFASMRH